MNDYTIIRHILIIIIIDNNFYISHKIRFGKNHKSYFVFCNTKTIFQKILFYCYNIIKQNQILYIFLKYVFDGHYYNEPIKMFTKNNSGHNTQDFYFSKLKGILYA